MFSFVLFLKAADAGRETQCDAGVGPSHNPTGVSCTVHNPLGKQVCQAPC